MPECSHTRWSLKQTVHSQKSYRLTAWCTDRELGWNQVSVVVFLNSLTLSHLGPPLSMCSYDIKAHFISNVLPVKLNRWKLKDSSLSVPASVTINYFSQFVKWDCFLVRCVGICLQVLSFTDIYISHIYDQLRHDWACPDGIFFKELSLFRGETHLVSSVIVGT